MDKQPLAVAAYTRVSTGKQLTEGHGLEVQTQAIDNYCKAHGWQIAARYQDVYTGTDDQRPALQRLLGDAAQATFNAVVFYDLSRFARNTLHLLQLVEQLNAHGVSIVSVHDGLDTATNKAIGQLMITILGAFAAFEHATIKRRMNDARQKLWQEQKVYLGRVPVGYKAVDGKLEVDPNTAPLVQRIFSLYVGGLAMGKIATLLRREGHKTQAGKPYTSGALSLILGNELYTGYKQGNRYVYNGNRATDQLKPQDQWVDIVAPALVSRSLFEQAQAKIKANRSKVKRTGGLQWAWLRDA